MPQDAVTEIRQFLQCETPDKWKEIALDNLSILLIDHANCEKKAAGSALNLMYRYIDNPKLLNKMSRLAREELRHFEQVTALMAARDIPYEYISASRYAAGMRKGVRTFEPARLIDTLIVGAIIEARSCERFASLAPALDDELQSFYLSLLKSEGRHYQDYLSLAKEAAEGFCSDDEFDQRVTFFLKAEKELIISDDKEFRFHSGVPKISE